MVKYKQIMQVSLCGNIERDAFNVVTVNGGDAMNMIGRCLRTEGIERDALKAGEELPGAKLVAGYRLAVR